MVSDASKHCRAKARAFLFLREKRKGGRAINRKDLLYA